MRSVGDVPVSVGVCGVSLGGVASGVSVDSVDGGVDASWMRIGCVFKLFRPTVVCA